MVRKPAYQVGLSDRALRDVEEVLAWFQAERATAAGKRWHAQLIKKIDTLELHPERCPLADEGEELEIELRELLYGRRHKYRILFIIDDRRVEILHIRHTARDTLSRDDLT